MSDLKQKFGRRLRFLRRQRDMTQEKLAESIGVSVEFLSNLERGVNAPSFETLQKLSDTLKTPVKDLFDFKESA